MIGADSASPRITLRPARPDDCRRVWEWRNEPVTRQASFNTTEISYEDHERWFARRLSDGRTRFFIVLDPLRSEIGYVRFDLAGPAAEISISLAPRARGSGYGAQAIRGASDAILAEGVQFVVARIKPGNAASVAAFASAGFVPAGSVRIADVDAEEMIYPAGRPLAAPHFPD